MKKTGPVGEAYYDYSKLKALIVERGFTHAELSALIPLNQTSFSQKINGRREFRQKEINKIVHVLGANVSDIPVYFFTKKLRN
jgi:DNA-binding Xre family transcriptional regulator